MPFTVSHVAAVLPAHRLLTRAHLFSAAVIGSMVPDFGFWLPGALARWQTHSLPGLFKFCLPVGLAAYVLMLLLKPAAIELASDGVHARLCATGTPRPTASLSGWLLIALVILLGAATHLIWDGFTHENARGVRMFPLLESYGFEVDGHSLQLWRWLQYLSSVVGLAIVIAAIIVWVRHAPTPVPPPSRRLRRGERRLWISAYLALPALAVGVALLHLARRHVALPSGEGLEAIAVAGMRGSGVALVLVSLLLRARLALQPAALPA